MKKVLIIGGNCYIGRHLSDDYKGIYELAAIDNTPSKIDNLSRLSQNPIKQAKSIEFNNINNNNTKVGGSYTSDKLEKLEKLEIQNKKMKLLLENHLLKHKIAKLLKSKDKTMYNEAIKALLG